MNARAVGIVPTVLTERKRGRDAHATIIIRHAAEADRVGKDGIF